MPGPVHGFADESVRGSTYLLAVAVVPLSGLAAARSRLRSLRLPGQRRIHFKHERDDRRRYLLGQFAELCDDVHIHRERNYDWRHDQTTRNRLLTEAVRDLQRLDGRRLVVESREGRDQRDRAALRQVLPTGGPLSYEHLRGYEEPLLWLPDAFAWAYGRGGDWRSLLPRG